MKHLHYKLLMLAGIAFLSSCKKSFLDQTGETTVLYRENYIKNLSGMNEYLSGIYLEFNKNWAHCNPRNYTGYPELMADNLKPTTNLVDMVAKYKWGQQPGTDNDQVAANMTSDWEGNYRVIRTSSFLIEDIDKYGSENPAKADYMEGQALVFRALMHFKLANVFAQPYNFTPDASHPGIPYITTSDVSQTYTRQTVKEVYDKIISDLIHAIDLMKNNPTSDIRYLNQDAAKAILSRVYLYKGDYINSLSLAKELCIRHPLMTIFQGFPDGLFYNKPSTDTEVLFQTSPADFPAPDTRFIGTYIRGMFYYATNDIASLLTESGSDVRSNWVAKIGDHWIVSKFPIGVAGLIVNKNGDYYEPVVRSSELFLNAAEASAKTGDEANARLYLNQLRKRSDPNAIDINLSGADLLNAIYKERRKELCFENFRLFDLLRWKMGVHRTDVYDNAPTTLPYGSDHAISPIPKREIEIMGLTPNPGY